MRILSLFPFQLLLPSDDHHALRALSGPFASVSGLLIVVRERMHRLQGVLTDIGSVSAIYHDNGKLDRPRIRLEDILKLLLIIVPHFRRSVRQIVRE